jgi:quinoprotein glucose dehydrogenase
LLYVPSHTLPALVWAKRNDNPQALSSYRAETSEPFAGPRGLPLTKPPYGRITAIDMQTAEHVWMSPVGRGPVDHPALRDLDLPDLGWANRSFAVATSTLLLVASQDPDSFSERRRRRSASTSQEAYLRAFDLDTGDLVGQVALPGNASGSPMTYMVAGRQYIAVPVGNRRSGPELVVLALP